MASTSDERPVSANVTADVHSPPSDNDSGERPVRQQLKETTIESNPTTGHDGGGGRKRSFEESREDHDSTEKGESRKKRSRENTPENSNKKSTSKDVTTSAQTGNVSENQPKDPAKNSLKPMDWICDDCKYRKSSYRDSITQTDIVGEVVPSGSLIKSCSGLPTEKAPEIPKGSSAEGSSSDGSLHGQDAEHDTSPLVTSDDSLLETSQPESSSPYPESPKSSSMKRTREELEADDSKASESADPTTEAPEPEKKRPRDSSQEPETKTNNGFAGSAFAKAVGDSPFTSLGKKAASTEESSEKTSASAFASSSLAGFAGSEKSPFGTLGASTPSVFKSATPTGFGSLGSGFSGVGGGFSAAAKPGGLTSFASSTAVTLKDEDTPEPSETKDTDADKAGSAEKSEDPEKTNASTFKAEKTDDRFYEQEMSTGEEGEENVFTCKAKLFNFIDGEWRERGIGTFKVNARKENGRRKGRMIMRADGAMRVMLNSPIFEGMKCGDMEGKAPTTKQLFLASMEDGKLVSCLLRTGKQDIAAELYDRIHELLEDDEAGQGEEKEGN